MYRRSVPALNGLATKQFDATRTYSEVVHFVNVYVTEPHPMTDPSPYTGTPLERRYSTRRQPTTYRDRVALAGEVAALLEGEQIVLVDEMSPRPRVNPVWCSYGPMPNSAYLITMDGTLHLVQQWEDPRQLETAIDELLRR